VLFYVHSPIIWAASETAFSSFLFGVPSENAHDAIINIPEDAAVLNIILYTLYSTSCAQHSPSLQSMVTAVERMPFYNLDPEQFIQPGLPLYMLLLSSAPLYPIDIYCLAAKFHLEKTCGQYVIPSLVVWAIFNHWRNGATHGCHIPEALDVLAPRTKSGIERYTPCSASSSSNNGRMQLWGSKKDNACVGAGICLSCLGSTLRFINQKHA